MCTFLFHSRVVWLVYGLVKQNSAMCTQLIHSMQGCQEILYEGKNNRARKRKYDCASKYNGFKLCVPCIGYLDVAIMGQYIVLDAHFMQTIFLNVKFTLSIKRLFIS